MHCVHINKISVKSTFSLANNAEIDFTKVCIQMQMVVQQNCEFTENKHFSVKLTILTNTELISRKIFQRDTEWKSRHTV